MKQEVMERIKQLVLEEFGNDFEVQFRDVMKNNGVVRKSVMIKGPFDTVTPSIYIDNALKELEDGIMEADEVASNIVQAYKEARIQEERFCKVSSLNKETILKHVTYQLVNKENNKERLKGCPFKEILDMAALYRVIVSVSDEGISGFLLTNELRVIYGISYEELDAAAMKNTIEKLGVRISKMEQLLQGHSDIEQDIAEGLPMYVITNKYGINGASVILYGQYMDLFADRIKDDFYILPSSIHEVITIPCSYFDEDESEYLGKMVRDANLNVVADEEILSYSVYKYSRKDGLLMII